MAIGHSYDEPPICRWDWREQVLPLEVNAVTEPHGVLAAVLADDRKRTVSALLDNPVGPSSLTALLHSSATGGGSASSSASPKTSGAKGCCPTPSTVDGSETSDVASGGYPTGADLAKEVADAYDPVVANAVREIKEQLNIRRNDGRVDIPHWNDRYGEALGPLREFIESRPDKFTVIPEAGGKFTVVKARKRHAAEGRAEFDRSLALRAVAEIEEQLNAPNHDGRVSIPRWSERYEDALGSLRSFVKSWPDKFTVIAGEGRHFRVVKKSEGTALHAIREIDEQLDHPDFDGQLQIPRWGERYGEELGSLKTFLESWPDRFTVIPGEDCSFSVMKTADAMGKRAIAEIEAQLIDPEHDGFLRIPHWSDQFAPSLGSLRSFLESRPDKFHVTPGDNRNFTVAKCSCDMAQRAIKEIEEQINDPRHDGRVRVPHWNERFKESLGPLRSFLESWPDKFKVVPGEGSKFVVRKSCDGLATSPGRTSH